MTTTQTEPNPQSHRKSDHSPIEQVQYGLDKLRGQLQATLPSHIPVDRFQRVVLTAVNINPDLLSADRRSLFNAAVRAAQDGLLPDGREGALVIFKDKSGKKLVQWMPMVFGLIKKIRQSGEIDGVGARIVYHNEIEQGRFKFVIEEGQEKLYHEPIQYGPRGEKMFVYGYARFKNGHVEYEPLHRDDVMKRKAQSRGGNIWSQWEEEMWRKTAIRALAKRLPLSADIMRTVEREPGPTQFEQLKADAEQNAAAAMAQIGAPVPEPETEISEGGHGVVIDGAIEFEDEVKFTEAKVQQAIDHVEFAKDRKELAEWAKEVHDMIGKAQIPEELRASLKGEFDQVCEARARELEITETKGKLL